MPSFRDELRESRRQVEEAARQERLRADQEARDRDRRIEQERQEAERNKRIFYQKYILPTKPMVERLLRDLGDEVWGPGNYGLVFSQPEETCYWKIGRSEYYTDGLRSLFGSSYYWKKLTKHESDFRSWRMTEYFLINLSADDTQLYATGNAATRKNIEQRLRDELRAAYLRGPEHSFPPPSTMRQGG